MFRSHGSAVFSLLLSSAVLLSLTSCGSNPPPPPTDPELARARTRGALSGRGGRIEVAPLVEKLAGALQRTPHGEALSWSIDIAEDLTTPIDRDDLTEILGNLLENAMKWARSTIQVTGAVDRQGVPCLEVADDGPGIDQEHLPTVLSRGGRLSDTVPGTGLGLAIVQDVMAAYGAKITFARHPKLGGLSVTVALAQTSPDRPRGA